jgi:hypothetical protein
MALVNEMEYLNQYRDEAKAWIVVSTSDKVAGT